MPELTDEQLQNMSPEQLAEVQKQQCIFCQIISGKVASKKVYEDDKCLAILDINPANPGHVLILPKEHFTIMQMLPDPRVEHLFKIAQRISKAQIRGLQVDGTNIFVANGAAAGQKAPHCMIHVIPRKEGDGVTVFKLPKNEITPADQEKLRVAIKRKVNERFGISEKVVREQVDETPAAPQQPRQETGSRADEQNEEEKEEEKLPEESSKDKPGQEKQGKGFSIDKIASLFK